MPHLEISLVYENGRLSPTSHIHFKTHVFRSTSSTTEYPLVHARYHTPWWPQDEALRLNASSWGYLSVWYLACTDGYSVVDEETQYDFYSSKLLKVADLVIVNHFLWLCHLVRLWSRWLFTIANSKTYVKTRYKLSYRAWVFMSLCGWEKSVCIIFH